MSWPAWSIPSRRKATTRTLFADVLGRDEHGIHRQL
jgi:hypothetical protein